MKIRTSYYYQIRNFKPNMIPVSTTISDPLYFHEYTGDYNHIFKDKRGIVNGLRILPIIECGRAASSKDACGGPKNCSQDSATCAFLHNYYRLLNKNVNFEEMMHTFSVLADLYQSHEHIEDEIIIVLIVYEAPRNPCSERASLIRYFNEHGVECSELDYPIEETN